MVCPDVYALNDQISQILNNFISIRNDVINIRYSRSKTKQKIYFKIISLNYIIKQIIEIEYSSNEQFCKSNFQLL